MSAALAIDAVLEKRRHLIGKWKTDSSSWQRQHCGDPPCARDEQYFLCVLQPSELYEKLSTSKRCSQWKWERYNKKGRRFCSIAEPSRMRVLMHRLSQLSFANIPSKKEPEYHVVWGTRQTIGQYVSWSPTHAEKPLERNLVPSPCQQIVPTSLFSKNRWYGLSKLNEKENEEKPSACWTKRHLRCSWLVRNTERGRSWLME